MKCPCSEKSVYFYAEGFLYWVRNGERKGIYNPPTSYNSITVVRETAERLGVHLKGDNNPGLLEKFIEELERNQLPRDEIGGIFVGSENGTDGKAKVVHTGKIVAFREFDQEELARFLFVSKE